MDTGSLDTLSEAAERALQEIGKVVLDAAKPPPGPYAFFHHQGHAIERIHDVRLVLHRLLTGRRQLTDVLGTPHYNSDGGEVPEFHELMNRQHEIVQHMKLDFESLYLFGHLLLEQWAHVAARVVGVDLSERSDGAFTALYRRLEARSEPDLAPVWDQAPERIIWLFWQLRFYRNRFITHANRPWQRGSHYSHVGSDFSLFVPSPPGWVDFDIGARVEELWLRLPVSITSLLPGDSFPAERLRVMRERIGTIPKRELREEIGGLHRDLGGESPTFQLVGEMLLTFVGDATAELVTIAAGQPSRVLLGPGSRLDRLPSWPAEKRDED